VKVTVLSPRVVRAIGEALSKEAGKLMDSDPAVHGEGSNQAILVGANAETLAATLGVLIRVA
jgi:hypothetical protein